MLDVALTPLAKRVLQAIAAAGVDPGLLGWGELRDRLHTSDQVLARTANRLEDDGLVVQEGRREVLARPADRARPRLLLVPRLARRRP